MRGFLALVFLLPVAAWASQGVFTLQEENDLFALHHQSDRSYTNGTRMVWEWEPAGARFLPHRVRDGCRAPECRTRVALGLIQTMYTPQNLKETRPISGDRPYGGWLAGVAMADVIRSSTIDHIELYLGIVGPHAYSKQTQTFIHNTFGFQHPNGWANQIGDQPGIEAIYQRRWYVPEPRKMRRYVDLTPAASVGVGTVFDYVGASVTARLGVHLPDRFLPPLPAPSAAPPPQASSASEVVNSATWDAFVFATAGRKLIGYNVFIDDAPPFYRIHREPFFDDRQVGVSVRFHCIRVQYAHTIRGAEFTPDYRRHSYGIATLSVGANP
jgi:lipid A 3-O-deacylase